MNYMALIENRKSAKAFRNKGVSASSVKQIRDYYEKGCQHLIPGIRTELAVLGTDARKALEGSAGYQDFLLGAPNYLVLLSEKQEHAEENAGYMMEDLILKLTDLELDSCWLTFTDAEKVKEALGLSSDLTIMAMAAFGYGERTAKKMHLNILSMSNVDAKAKRNYFSHKKDIDELVFVGKHGCSEGLEELMGFYDDMLWQSFYAVSQTPSYLNRQPYSLIIKDHDLILVSLADPYTDELSAKQNLGVVMLHFAAVAGQWVGKVNWDLSSGTEIDLPEGAHVAAVYHM